MKKLIATILAALAILVLSGCATGQYEAYAAAQTATAQARHQAEAERYKALAAIAMSGSDTARVAAVMSLSGLGGGGAQAAQPGPAITAPRSPGDTALQWASILLPSVTQLYSIGQQVKLGTRQSDNATTLGVSTNAAFVGLAGKIQAPAANVTTTIGANSGANSGNSGRLAGTSITDNTSTPTVVVQPAPVIVRPEVVRPEVIQPTTPVVP
jgi:hypothetical protein